MTGHEDNDERGRRRAPTTEHDDADEPGEGGDPVRCPFCDATTVSTMAPFGSQLLMSQFRCEACRSYFEGVRLDRYDLSEAEPAAPPGPDVC